MITTVFLLSIIGIIIYFIRKKSGNNSSLKVDYSFGIVEAKNARLLLVQAKYDELDLLILNLKPDILTLTVDYLALTNETAVFSNWQEKSKEKDVAKLCLGVCYLHKAWISRSHASGNDVSEEKANEFFEYQDLSWEQLSTIDDNFKLFPEVNSRLIRLAMGMQNDESITKYFINAISEDNTVLWPYLHYCEAIEPKWGGDIDMVKDLLKSLPKAPVIQQAIELKLVLDSLKMDENYFGGTAEELNQKAKTLIVKIDNEIALNPVTSINKYIVYGYIYLIAGFVNNKKLEKKYMELLNGNYTLYPFGINV